IGAWRSLVARLPWAQEVPGSNPGAPTSVPIRVQDELTKTTSRSSTAPRLASAQALTAHDQHVAGTPSDDGTTLRAGCCRVQPVATLRDLSLCSLAPWSASRVSPTSWRPTLRHAAASLAPCRFEGL